MAAEPADVTLLDDPVARELLGSTQVARLAYTWTDGTPRVVPIWFHYDGGVITMGTPARIAADTKPPRPNRCSRYRSENDLPIPL